MTPETKQKIKSELLKQMPEFLTMVIILMFVLFTVAFAGLQMAMVVVGTIIISELWNIRKKIEKMEQTYTEFFDAIMDEEDEND